MKQIYLVLFSALALLLVMFGCRPSVDSYDTLLDKQQTEKASDEAPLEIRIWTKNRHDNIYMNEVIQHFNEINDDIHVIYEVYAEDFEESVEVAYAINDAPDILLGGAGSLYVEKVRDGAFEPLNPYLTDDYIARFGEDAFIEGVNMLDGNIYSLPAVGSTPRLYYNKEIFDRVGIEAPPKTLDEMVETAKQITEELSEEGIYGYAQNFNKPASGIARSLDFILMRSGGNYRGYDYTTGEYDFSPYEPIIDAYQEMFSAGAVYPGIESLDIDPLRVRFADGKIGMYISWTHSEYGVYRYQFPTDVDWGVAQLPTVSEDVVGTQHVILAGRWFFINSASKNKDAAWRVMEYLYSDEVLAGYHEEGLGSVIVPGALEKTDVSDAVREWPELALTENDRVWPLAPSDIGKIDYEGEDMYNTILRLIMDPSANVRWELEYLSKRYNKGLESSIENGAQRRFFIKKFNPLNP